MHVRVKCKRWVEKVKIYAESATISVKILMDWYRRARACNRLNSGYNLMHLQSYMRSYWHAKNEDCSTALRRSHLARTGLPITNSIGSRPLPEKHILTIENISFDALKAISGSYSNVNARTHHLISAGGIFSRTSSRAVTFYFPVSKVFESGVISRRAWKNASNWQQGSWQPCCRIWRSMLLGFVFRTDWAFQCVYLQEACGG